jgi:hypothetical protein
MDAGRYTEARAVAERLPGQGGAVVPEGGDQIDDGIRPEDAGREVRCLDSRRPTPYSDVYEPET